LREVIEFSCKNVPYYRRLFAEAGLKPGEIPDDGDLARVPSWRSHDQGPGGRRFRHGDKNKLRLTGTSGTTARQGVFYMSKEAEGRPTQRSSCSSAGRVFAGGKPHPDGRGLPEGFEKTTKDILFNCHYFSAFDVSDADLERIGCSSQGRGFER